MNTHQHRDSDRREAARAIFNEAEVCAVDAALIDKMKAEALRSPLGRYRICMHHSADDPMQDMIVVHRRGNYSRPHLHPQAATSYTIIEGQLDLLLFDDAGEVTERVCLRSPSSPDDGSVSVHLSAGVIHMPVCVSETAVFHETLGGAHAAGSTNYPPWAPSDGETVRIAEFLRRVGVLE